MTDVIGTNPLEGATALTNQSVAHADTSHVFHSWSAQGSLNPLPIAGGSGCTVWDHDGNRYLDFSSMLVNTNIGHQHPAVVAAIKEQADLLTTVGPAFANTTRARAAELILERAGDSFSKVFFTNGGADAIENAIRMARLHTDRDKVLSTYRSYHGNTGAAVVATGDWRRIPNEFARGHVHFFGPFLYRTEFWANSEAEECARALHHLERIIQAEGPASIAAILLETIPGTAGIMVPPRGYLAGVRALADRYGIVLILDEVMAGFGRSGGWFAYQALAAEGDDPVVPDLITFAKGVNSGYVPAGGVIIPPHIASTFDDVVFPGGLTYSGHPLAMAAIVGALTAMAEDGIVENAARIGADVLGPALRDLARRHSTIGEVRGTGVFWALDLVSDPSTREPLPGADVAALKNGMLAHGVLPFTADNRIHMVPPCIVTDNEVAQAVAALDAVLTDYESAQ